MIYRHALIARDVYVLDMPPDQFKTLKSSAKGFRKVYRTVRFIDREEADLPSSCRREQSRCQLQPPLPSFFKTIYTMDADRNSDLSPALLRTNKEVRMEAHPIFYSENTFFFYSMSAVMPFLRDRTPESLASIRSIGFHLAIDGYVEGNAVDVNWVCIFRDVSRIAGLRLQDLNLKIHSRIYGPSRGGWATNALDWAYSITRIKGLQTLRIEFDLDSTETSSNGKPEHILGAESLNAHWLWCWLAPRMLTDHEGAIQKAAMYLKSDEAARGKDCLFVLDGVYGGGLAWDIRKAMS